MPENNDDIAKLVSGGKVEEEVLTITITARPASGWNVNLSANFDNKVILYGMIEMAKDIVITNGAVEKVAGGQRKVLPFHGHIPPFRKS